MRLSSTRRRATRAVLLALAATLSACAGGVPDMVHVALRADRRLNPDQTGLAVPTQVRVYVLGTAEKFTATDYFQLVDNEKDALGGTAVASEQVTVRPGEQRTVDLKTAPGGRVLGVAVSYRSIDRATWRATLPIPSSGRVSVAVGADRVVLAPGS